MHRSSGEGSLEHTFRSPGLLMSGLREMTLIVVSILVAFTVDAWWGDQVEGRNARGALESVAAEIADNRRELGGMLALHARIEAHLEVAAVRAGDALASESAIAIPDSVLSSLLRAPTSDMQPLALSHFLQAGGLEHIESPVLATALLSWPAKVTDYQQEEWRSRDFVMTQLSPELRERGDVRIALARTRQAPGELAASGGEDTFVLDGSMALANVLAERANYQRITVYDLRALIGATDRLLELLEVELR